MTQALATAQKTDRGIVATCPTTGEPFITSQPKYTTFEGHTGVWCRCRHCDAHGRTRVDAAFNPSEPQQHPYLLDEARDGA